MTFLFLLNPENAEEASSDVMLAIEELMAYRLRASGFATGAGGVELEHFTAQTTPTLARAKRVANRKAVEVSRAYDLSESETAVLVSIAALRSAIELETSAPNFDPERIRVWRDELREYVRRADQAGAGGSTGVDPDPGERPLAAVWGFGDTCPPRAPGAEAPWPPRAEPVCADPARARRYRW